MNYSRTIKSIRISNNISQKELISDLLSQSNYSKYEKGYIDISSSSFKCILNNLNISLDEVDFIHNDYRYSERKSIFNDFFKAPVNNKEFLLHIINRCNLPHF